MWIRPSLAGLLRQSAFSASLSWKTTVSGGLCWWLITPVTGSKTTIWSTLLVVTPVGTLALDGSAADGCTRIPTGVDEADTGIWISARKGELLPVLTTATPSV